MNQIKNNISLIIIHVIFWLFLASIPFYFNASWFGWKIGLLRTITPIFFLMTVAYLNALVFIPYFFRRDNFVWYYPFIAYIIVVPLALLIFENIFIFVNALSNVELSLVFKGSKDGVPFEVFEEDTATKTFPRLVVGMMLLLNLFVSSLYGFTVEFARKEREEAELQAINLSNELKLLRSQINPHFLFNALNNLYAIVQLKPDKAGDFVLKLSEMLRYVTYDCQREKVAISKEIDYLHNYIYFQKWRDRELQDIQLDIDATVLGMTIEPMLLIPFVENAFKHSYNNGQKRWINITLKKANNELIFEVENSLSEVKTEQEIPDEYTGIGIDNIKKRLAILYLNRYDLKIEKRAESFYIKLRLDQSNDN